MKSSAIVLLLLSAVCYLAQIGKALSPSLTQVLAQALNSATDPINHHAHTEDGVDLKPVCSSLADGPFCKPINGKINPRSSSSSRRPSSNPKKYPIGSSGDQNSLIGSIVDAIVNSESKKAVGGSSKPIRGQKFKGRRKGNTAGKVDEDRPDSGPYADGSFYLHGTYDPSTQWSSDYLKIEMRPGKWISQPSEEWVSLGFRGKIVRKATIPVSFELQAAFVDEDDEFSQICSTLVATRVDLKTPMDGKKEKSSKGFRSWSELLTDSVWKGRYNCAGLDTELTLRIYRTKKVPSSSSASASASPPSSRAQLSPGEIGGRFDFVVASPKAKKKVNLLELWEGSLEDLEQVLEDGESLLAAAQQLAKATLSDLSDQGSLGDKKGIKKKKQTTKSMKSRLTQSGCQCLQSWKEEIVEKDGTRIEYSFENGDCGNPGNRRQIDYCKVVKSSCKYSPAGSDWDYCERDWKERKKESEAETTVTKTIDLGTYDLEDLEEMLTEVFPDETLDEWIAALGEDSDIKLKILTNVESETEDELDDDEDEV